MGSLVGDETIAEFYLFLNIPLPGLFSSPKASLLFFIMSSMLYFGDPNYLPGVFFANSNGFF